MNVRYRRTGGLRRLVPALTTALLAATVVWVSAPPSSAAQPQPAIRGARSASAIPESYLVKLKDTPSVRAHGLAARAQTLTDTYHGTLGEVWDKVLHGFAATMTEDQARKLAAEPDVDYIQQNQWRLATRSHAAPSTTPAGTRSNHTVTPAANQTPVSWGLDRIDQHALPLDNHYSYDNAAGQNVHVYVLDSGIEIDHPDFGGRASYGPNFVPDGQPNSDDCTGSGTESAGEIGGVQYGVAKKASMVAVRIFGCNGLGDFSGMISALNWVVGHAIRPAVIDFDLADQCFDPKTGQPVPCDPTTIDNLINAQETAFANGIAVVANAGDNGTDTCNRQVGAAPDDFYVGATSSNDARAGFSNFGSCLTMFAPGDGVTTDTLGGSRVSSSTVDAAAYVAGTVALFMSKPEFAGASPGRIRDELVKNRSTPGVITGLDAGSPNRLLFTGPPGLFTIGDPLGLAQNGDGRLHMFGVDPAGHIVQREQTERGGNSWSGWTPSLSKGWQSVGVETNADGRLELTGMTTTGDTFQRAQTVPNSNTWLNWAQLTRPPNAPSVPIARVVMAHNLSNRMEIFATNQQGQAYYRSQTAPGSATWGPWIQFPFAGKMRSVTAVANLDSRIEVLGVDDAGQVWHAAQTSPTDNNWSAFTKLDGFAMASIAAARNGDGTLELVGVDTGGGVWHRAQTTAGSPAWSDWSPLPQKTLADVATETNTDGRVHLVGVDNVGNIWQATKTAANTGASFSTWAPLDGQLRP